MNSLGEIIRKLREGKDLPLRTVAAYLAIDPAILSKIERGQRKAPREQVVKLAAYFKVKEDDLLIAWLSDKVVYEVRGEEMALKALQAAEEKVIYQTRNNRSSERLAEKNKVSRKIQRYFQLQNMVSKAWIFGSFAREENTLTSDIDILIDVPSEKKFTLFDIAEVQEQLQKIVNKKVDVVMLNGIRPEIKELIKIEMQLIYEAC